MISRKKGEKHFCLVLCRWRPKTFARQELQAVIRNAVEDSYKRLILPFLTRSYRFSCFSLFRKFNFKSFSTFLFMVLTSTYRIFSLNLTFWILLDICIILYFIFSSPGLSGFPLIRTKLTGAAEKESIAMFVRNLRQRLLVCPVRGCVMMGVDPGFRHGCKLAILSPTSNIHKSTVFIVYRKYQSLVNSIRNVWSSSFLALIFLLCCDKLLLHVKINWCKGLAHNIKELHIDVTFHSFHLLKHCSAARSGSSWPWGGSVAADWATAYSSYGLQWK